MWKLGKTGKENRKTISTNRLVLWSHLSLVFFLAALSCLLCKYAQISYSLFVVSTLGLIMTFCWGTKGFLYSICFITTVSISISNGLDLWNALFAISIILSCLLLLLGRQEISSYFKKRTLKEQDLEERCIFLQKKIDRLQELMLKEELQEKQQETVLLKKQLEELNDKASKGEKEKSFWLKRHYTIIKQVAGYQQLVKKLQAELANACHMQAESKKNFQEKSNWLDQARKQVFYLENALLALQRDCLEKEFDPQVTPFIDHIMRMQEIQHNLECEIFLLEEIICSVCNQKKKAGLQKIKPKITAKKTTSKLLQNKINKLSANRELSKSHSPHL